MRRPPWKLNSGKSDIPLGRGMEKEGIDAVVQQSSSRLLQIAGPPVRYWVFRFVRRMTDDDIIQRRTLDECATYLPRIKLLRTLRPDGTWPVPQGKADMERRGLGLPFGQTYTTMLRNLYMLAEYKTPPEEGHIMASLEKILSWQTPEGWIPGPEMVGIPETHSNGFALGILNRFGMEKDPRVQRLSRWLMSMQRRDGGWNIPYIEDVRHMPEYKYMRMSEFVDLVRHGKIKGYEMHDYDEVPSCIWTTLMVLRGLVQDPALRHDDRTRRGGDFFLEHFFKRNYHAAYYRSEKNWTTLKYPTWHGSGLCGLDMLTAIRFGPADPRMDWPVKWLVEARSRDGLWHQSGRPDPGKDQWISVTALGSLARYAEMFGT